MAIQLMQSTEDEVISQINTTPLVDVMLVLLIIFLITIPVVTTSVPVSLPQERNVVRESKPENLIISVNAKGRIFLYDAPMNSSEELMKNLRPYATKSPQPEVQIRGDANADFESIGRVMNALQRSGLSKVGFVTQPQ
jgi:biopolymer transport protein ExbD